MSTEITCKNNFLLNGKKSFKKYRSIVTPQGSTTATIAMMTSPLAFPQLFDFPPPKCGISAKF